MRVLAMRRLVVIFAVGVLVVAGMPRPGSAETPAPTPRPGLASVAAKDAVTCAKALTKAANGFVGKKAASLKKCTDAVATCLQGSAEAVPACLGKARAKCDAAFATIAAEETKLGRTLASACTRITPADLLADAGLGFGLPALAATCAELGVDPLAQVTDVAACVGRFHACQVEQLLSVQVPLAGYLLGLVDRPLASAACTAVVPVPEPTPRLGTVPVAAKEVVKCTKAIGKAANGFVTKKAALLKKCTDPIAACVQGKPEALAACVLKARAKCDQQFAGIGKEEAKLIQTIADKCGRVTADELLAETGLGFGLPALAAACSAVGVPVVADAADAASCIARFHECRVEQLLSVQVPLASYLLGLVGRPLVSDYCAQPTPLPTLVTPGATATPGDPNATATVGAATVTAGSSGTAATPTPTVPAATPTPGGPFIAAVNPGLAPPRPTLEDGGTPETVGIARDAFGVATEFVEGLVIVKPASADELQAFLARYDGTVVRDDTVPQPPADFGITLSEEERAPTSYLVRLDLERTNVANVNANAAAAGLAGVLEFSSENGRRTFAGLMDARAQGFRVSGNFVYQGDQAFPRTLLRTEERQQPLATSAATPMPTPVFNDALGTAAYNDYGDIGNRSTVKAAWQFVAAHGIARRTRVAIIDGGFWLDAQGRALGADSDFPAPPAVPAQFDVDFNDGIAAGSNANNCGAGNPCYWHGTGSAGSAMGIANNRRGGAGAGAQVADPILLRVNGTKAQRNIALRIAVLWQADVVSMSFGGRCNVWCRIDDRDDNPFDDAVAAGSRVVFVASAGNGDPPPSTAPPGSSNNGFFVGDPNFVHPCTEENVICVGALAPNSLNKIQYSNFGGQVQIFAPTNIPAMSFPNSFSFPPPPALPIPLPPSQAAGPEVPQTFTGTSASAPFVAGVAAMIKALKPDLSHGEVAQILRDSARTSPDGQVTRALDAYAALLRAAVDTTTVSDALEPNSLLAPTNLGSAASYARQNLNLDAPDRDYFQLASPGGALMTLALAYPAPLPAVSVERLESLGDCGRPQFVSEAPRAGGGKTLVYRVSGGPLQLGLRGDGVNAYNLGVTFAGDTFAPDAYEENDGAPTARNLFTFKAIGTGPLSSVGKDPRVTIDATLHASTDVDWYVVRGVKATAAEKVFLGGSAALQVYGNDSGIDAEVYRRNADRSVGAVVATVSGASCTPTALTVALDADAYYYVRVAGAPGRYKLRNGVAGEPLKIPLLVRDRVFEILNPLDPVVTPLRWSEAFVVIADPGYRRIRTTTPNVHLRLFDADGEVFAEGEALDPDPGEALALAGTIPGAAYALIVEPLDEVERTLELVFDPVEPVRTSENVIVNAGAEILSGNPSFPFVGWDVVPGVPSGQPLPWDGVGGNPAPTDPGPEDRGVRLFSGGLGNAVAGVRQLAFVDPDWKTAVDAGRARFRFRAFLGGFFDQGDAATATVTFRDVAQQPLADPIVLGPVTALEREDQTALLPVEAAGGVPPNTFILDVEIRSTRAGGNHNDGYADSLELVLSELPEP